MCARALRRQRERLPKPHNACVTDGDLLLCFGHRKEDAPFAQSPNRHPFREERQYLLKRNPERYQHLYEGEYATAFEGAYFAEGLAKAKDAAV
jgi:hypothetical protein